MSRPDQERLYWNEHATPIDVWGEPDQEAGVVECQVMIEAGLDPFRGRVLDLGCGYGRLTLPLAEAHPEAELVGVDVSSRMVVQAMDERDRLGIRAAFYLGDGRHLPDDIGWFDRAYCVLLFQHLPYDAVDGYLHEVGDRLVPGGKLVTQHVDNGAAPSFMSYSYTVEQLRWSAQSAGLICRTVLTMGDPRPGWVWASWEKELDRG